MLMPHAKVVYRENESWRSLSRIGGLKKQMVVKVVSARRSRSVDKTEERKGDIDTRRVLLRREIQIRCGLVVLS